MPRRGIGDAALHTVHDICREQGVSFGKAMAEALKTGRMHGTAERGVRTVPAREAAVRIDLGPYAEWNCPARIYLNIERAFREFRGEAPDAPWDQLKLMDGLYAVAKARDLEPVF